MNLDAGKRAIQRQYTQSMMLITLLEDGQRRDMSEVRKKLAFRLDKLADAASEFLDEVVSEMKGDVPAPLVTLDDEEETCAS